MLRQHGRGHPGAHSAHLDDADDVLPEMAAGYVFLLGSVCADAVTLFPELLPSQLILMVGHGSGHCEGRPGCRRFSLDVQSGCFCSDFTTEAQK